MQHERGPTVAAETTHVLHLRSLVPSNDLPGLWKLRGRLLGVSASRRHGVVFKMGRLQCSEMATPTPLPAGIQNEALPTSHPERQSSHYTLQRRLQSGAAWRDLMSISISHSHFVSGGRGTFLGRLR